MFSKVSGEITYPFPNSVEVWEWITNFIPHITERVIIFHGDADVLLWRDVGGAIYKVMMCGIKIKPFK